MAEVRSGIPYDPDPPVSGRLDSWKEIAAYLSREVRTVQRWEKEEGLPVHRHAHKKLGSVYAYRSEVDAWSARRRVTLVDAPQLQALGVEAVASRRSPAWVIGVCLLLLAGALALTFRQSRRSEEGPLMFTQLTTDTGLTFQPAVSQDGDLVAYASDRGGGGNLDIWVQRTSRSEPVRLTGDAADDYEPAISPDGATVAFRSDRDGGGIYAVPASGGEARKLVDRGRQPRYSPDGKWLAYWEGIRRDRPGRIFVIPSGGGEPHPVELPDVIGLRSPVWAPDSTHLLFEACADLERSDWYVASLNGGPAVRTGARRTFLQSGLSAPPGMLAFDPDVWLADNDVLFSAMSGDSTNLWAIPISPANWKVAGPPRRRTSGTGMELHSSASRRGRLVFAGLVRNVDIWSIPIDSETGGITGQMQRLTNDAADDLSPSIAADGRRMAFESLRSGKRLVWTRDLDTGHEAPVNRTPSLESLPKITPNGTKIAYTSGMTKGYSGDLYWSPFKGGQPESICRNCGIPWGWSADSANLVYGDEDSLWVFDVARDRHYKALNVEGYGLWDGRFTPDGRWIMFSAKPAAEPQAALFAVPFRSGETRSRRDWLPAFQKVRSWSPGGSLAYSLGPHDGFTCIYAAPVHPGTRGQEPARPVYHFHHARLSLLDDLEWAGLSVARDKIVVSLREMTGNIWMAAPSPLR